MRLGIRRLVKVLQISTQLSVSCFRYDALLQEKEELEETFESFKQGMMLTQEGAASKEIRILKKVIRNLEVVKNRNYIETKLLNFGCWL